jgi:hypothetical protein
LRGRPRGGRGGGVGTWTWTNAPFDGNPASKSFERYYNEDYGASAEFIKAVDGRGRAQGRNLRSNLIVAYNFTEGRLKGLSSNLAFRYRSTPNLNYGLKTLPNGTVTFDLAKPIDGKKEFYTDLGVAYRGKLRWMGSTNYRVQMNVRNLLDDHDLVPNRALSNGQYVAWARVEPRLWVFTVGFDL